MSSLKPFAFSLVLEVSAEVTQTVWRDFTSGQRHFVCQKRKRFQSSWLQSFSWRSCWRWGHCNQVANNTTKITMKVNGRWTLILLIRLLFQKQLSTYLHEFWKSCIDPVLLGWSWSHLFHCYLQLEQSRLPFKITLPMHGNSASTLINESLSLTH